MNEMQARLLIMQHGGALQATRGGVEWFKKADGSWLALSRQPNGQYLVQAVAKEACGCN